MLFQRSSSLRCFLLVLWLPFVESAGVLAAEAGVNACAAAESLIVNTTLRGRERPQDDVDRFQLTLPQAGILTLDVSAPRPGRAQPKLTLLEDCTELDGADPPLHLIHENPLGLIVEVRQAGTYFVTVSAEDPQRSLNGYKLRNVFVADDDVVFMTASDGNDEPDDDIDEPDDDGFDRRAPAPGTVETDAEGAELFAGCHLGEVDDHGDTLLCATVLAVGEAASGVAENPFADDEDYFTFVLGGQTTVEIEGRGAGIWAVLYDGNGHRLSAGEGGSRIVRTLGAGRYHVRVGSRHDGEAYVLSVASLEAR